MSANIPLTPQGNMPAVGIPNSQDYPRLVFTSPYFETVAIAEIIEPSVTEAVEAILPALVPPYVEGAAQAAVQQLAVLLTGSTMSGPLFLSPIMPTQPSQAATMAYVDAMISTAGIPEVPPVPSGQVWARETGQWVPITPQTGVFLPLSGGTMVGNIAMSGNTINGLASVPTLPNGAAPAQWVLNQIAAVSLFQGQWDADTNVPDLTQLSVRVNGNTWIAITTSVSGVVIGPAIPGLQGKTIYNGDTIYYSTVDGAFFAIHAGGLTLPEADARYVQLGGSQMSGALLLNSNASQPLQAVTLQQLQAFVPPGAVGEAPNDGQLYGRNGLTSSWAPVLPLAGGILTGSLTLAANATQPLQPATYGQMTSAISAATAGFLPLSGGAMSGLMTLSGNASVSLNPVPLQQLTAMLATFAPLQNPAFTGVPSAPTATPATTSTTQIATTAFTQAALGAALGSYVPLAGGTMTGGIVNNNSGIAAVSTTGSVVAATGFFTTLGGNPGGTTINVSNPMVITGTNAFTVSGGPVNFGAGLNVGTSMAVNTTGAANGQLALLEQGNTARQWVLIANAGFLNISSSNVNDAIRYDGVNNNFQINGTTAYKPGGGAWSDSSDARIKNVIGPYEGGLAAICQLQPKQFYYLGNDDIDDEPSGRSPHEGVKDKLFNGLIADDVLPVFPECVTLRTGWIDGTRVDDLKTLDTTPLVYAMINALKELSARVGALEAR